MGKWGGRKEDCLMLDGAPATLVVIRSFSNTVIKSWIVVTSAARLRIRYYSSADPSIDTLRLIQAVTASNVVHFYTPSGSCRDRNLEFSIFHSSPRDDSYNKSA